MDNRRKKPYVVSSNRGDPLWFDCRGASHIAIVEGLNTIILGEIIIAILLIQFVVTQISASRSQAQTIEGKGRFLIEIVALGTGFNKHIQFRTNDLSEKHGDYQIKPECLFDYKPNPLERIKFFFQGVKLKFLILFRKGDSEPIARSDATIKPALLKTISESKAISEALKEEFARQISPRMVLFIAVIAIIGVVVYMVMTGGIIV